MKNITRIDVFPHIGSKIPAEVQDQIRTDLTAQQIAETIEVNRDSGLEHILAAMQQSKSPTQLIYTYEYTKVLTDVNRIDPDKQVPTSLYLGEQIINVTDDVRRLLIDKYAKPWQLELVNLAKAHPQATIIHWHSMDTYSGGKANLMADSNQPPQLRPIGQIISRADTHRDSIVHYFPDFQSEYIESQLVTTAVIPTMLQLFTDCLRTYSNFAENNQFVADQPYKLFGNDATGAKIFGPSLPGLIAAATNNKAKQLAFEIRKDLLQQCDYSQILETVNQVLGLMM